MLAEDFLRFEKAIRGLEFTYGKKISDEAMQQYWRALKDLPFEQVSERIQTHTRYAKFFPKPVELRPKEDRPRESDRAFDSYLADYQKKTNAALEDLRRAHPQEWLRVVRPKVHEVGTRRGMSFDEIEAKLQVAMECSGPLIS